MSYQTFAQFVKQASERLETIAFSLDGSLDGQESTSGMRGLKSRAIMKGFDANALAFRGTLPRDEFGLKVSEVLSKLRERLDRLARFCPQGLGRDDEDSGTWVTANAGLIDVLTKFRGVAGLGSTDNEAGCEKQPQRRRRGRKPDTDAKSDKRLAEAWQLGAFRTYAAFADAKGLTKRDVKLALDRHRHRAKAAEETRTR